MSASHERVLAESDSVWHASPTTASGSHLKMIVLVALTLLAAWLRLWHLGGKSLWLDEAAAVALARLPWARFAHEWWYGAASFQTTHLLLLRVWVALRPPTETWVRLPSALCGIASVPVLYVLARKLLGSASAALAAATMLAVNPTHVYYSQETRGYTLTILLLLASAIFLVRAVEHDSNKYWALWTVFSILAVYAHYFAALVLVAEACSLLCYRQRRVWRKLVFSGALIVAAALPGMTYVFRAPEFSSFSWMPRTTALAALHAAMFLGGSGLKFALVAVLWIAGTVSILHTIPDGGEPLRRWRGFLILSWAVLPMMLLAMASLRNPMFVNRYLIFSLPGTVMLAAAGMTALRFRYVGAGLVTALCLLCLPTVYKDYSKPREDWRDATASVLANARPGDAVVFAPEFTRVGFDYYAERFSRDTSALHFFSPPYYGDGETVQDMQRALAANPRQFARVWLVVVREFGDDERLPEPDIALEARLRSIYGAPAVQQFPAIAVLKFGRYRALITSR